MSRFKNGGFTLIEVVALLLILGILLPAILAPYLTAAKSVGQAASWQRLTMLARSGLDDEFAKVQYSLPQSSIYSRAASSAVIDGKTYSLAISAAYLGIDLQPIAVYSPLAISPMLLYVTAVATEAGSGRSVTLNRLINGSAASGRVP